MNRREFSNLLGGAAALWSQRAYAQQQAAPSSPIRRDWLDRRKEPILEPELPIIDPHHHLWQRPGWRYLLDDLLLDTGSGHNIVATVYMEASSMYRDRGPEEMRPVGEVEFANGVAAMCWPTRSSGKALRWSVVLAFPTMCRSIIPRSAKLPISRALCPIPESSSITSAAFSDWAPIAASAMKCLPAGHPRSRPWLLGPTYSSSSADWVRATLACASTRMPNRHRPRWWPLDSALTSKHASQRLGRRAVCLRAISPSTRSRTVITYSGMPAN